jgi:hypothetical protein
MPIVLPKSRKGLEQSLISKDVEQEIQSCDLPKKFSRNTSISSIK